MNVLENPGAETGDMTGWTVLENGGQDVENWAGHFGILMDDAWVSLQY